MILRGRVEPFFDAEALARAAARGFAGRAAAAAQRGQHFAVALTGGSSPGELYRMLGSPEFAERIPWEVVHLFWGDERAVPPEHPRSNYRLAHRLLVSRVPIPAANVHRMRGELGAERAAELYEQELREYFGSSPRFDLIHLGLGDNGHVASLFPFDLPRLTERERWVLPAVNPEIGEPRITLTVPVLNAARRVEFLLPSAGKAAIARIAAQGPLDPFRVPAQLVRPATGELVWMAAAELELQG